MRSPHFTFIQHATAVACVIVIGVLMHGALLLGGIDGPSFERADAYLEARIALPGDLR